MTRGERAAVAALALMAASALAAPLVAGADEGGPSLFGTGPGAQDLALRHAAPGTAGRPLGADALGRDVFARLVHGLRTSLVVAGVGAALAGVLGLAAGLVVGVARRGPARGFAAVVGALVDAGSAFPPLLVVAAVAATRRPDVLGVALLLGALRAPFVARLVRQETRRVVALPFVLAAEASGTAPWRVARRHVLPHVIRPALVAAACAVPGNVLAESALSFLGCGPPEPVASLGTLLRDGRAAIPYAPHLVLLPGLVTATLALACQTLADAGRRRAGAPPPEAFA